MVCVRERSIGDEGSVMNESNDKKGGNLVFVIVLYNRYRRLVKDILVYIYSASTKEILQSYFIIVTYVNVVL